MFKMGILNWNCLSTISTGAWPHLCVLESCFIIFKELFKISNVVFFKFEWKCLQLISDTIRNNSSASFIIDNTPAFIFVSVKVVIF